MNLLNFEPGIVAILYKESAASIIAYSKSQLTRSSHYIKVEENQTIKRKVITKKLSMIKLKMAWIYSGLISGSGSSIASYEID